MSTPLPVDAAQQYLRQFAGLQWLVAATAADFWSPVEVAEQLRESGMLPRASPGLVIQWCLTHSVTGALPGATYYGPGIGWRIPREGLVVFFALRLQNRLPHLADDEPSAGLVG